MGIFDFLKKLFPHPSVPQSSSSQASSRLVSPPRPPSSRAGPRAESIPLQQQLNQIRGKGRPEYPFLHPTYSPSSRIPCADFTPFIIERLAAGDVGSIGQLMRRIIEANPGLGTQGEWIEGEVKKTILAPLEKYLHFDGPNVYRQLRAMWIIAGRGGGGREFWLTNDTPRFFAQALCPYDLELLPAMEQLRRKANTFIRRMRKDAPFWLDVPLFKEADFTILSLATGEAVARVRQLTIGARLHLFYAVEKGGGRLPTLTGHIPRDMGLYALDSSQEILESGLLIPSQEPGLLKNSLQKAEILEACSQAGVSYKKSWNKDRLLQALLSAPPELVSKFIADVRLAAVNPEHETCLQALIARARQLEPVFKILCFSA